jgi:hypothetical protein
MPSALIVNPSRKRRRKGSKRRHHAKRRSNMLVPVGNPRRRRRNPMISLNPISAVKALIPTAIGSVAAGAIIGVLDAKMAGKSQLFTYGAKIAMAVLGAQFGRKLPFGLGNAIVGASFSSIGYSMGMKAAGGLVIPGAKTPAGAAELAAAIEEDNEIGALLDTNLRDHGMALLVDTGSGMAGLSDGIGDDGEGEMGDGEYNADA